MKNISDLSEAKRLLAEKYLRGELHLTQTSAEPQSQPGPAQVDSSGQQPRERVIPVQIGTTKRPFFYLHGDWKGQTFYCHPLAHALGEDQPFYLLEPYNFDDLPVPPSFEAMAAAHLKSMRAIQPQGPYKIGGWCNGGLIAYEIALQLLTQGQQVELLVLLDADGPHPTYRRTIRKIICTSCKLLRRRPERQVDLFLLVQHIYRYLRFAHYRARFSQYRRVQSSNKTPAPEQESQTRRTGFPLLERLIPAAATLRQDWPSIYEWIAYGYIPASLYPGKLTFIWDSVDTWRPAWWQKVVKAKADQAEIHVVPGNHVTCRTEYLPVLAEHLRMCIDNAQAVAVS